MYLFEKKIFKIVMSVCETVDIVEEDFDGMKTIFENLILINEIQKSQKNKKSSLLFSVPAFIQYLTKGRR